MTNELAHDPKRDSRHPPALCMECAERSTRYRCKACGQPVCFICGLGPEAIHIHMAGGVDETYVQDDPAPSHD